MGKGKYCTTCYRKFVREKKECRRCHRVRTIVANGYCGSCYNYIMGYYERGRLKPDARLKRRIKLQKCLFCSEKRMEMLEIYQNKVLLCPNHYREVQLGVRRIRKP